MFLGAYSDCSFSHSKFIYIHYTKLCSVKKPSFVTGASWLSGAGLGHFALMVTLLKLTFKAPLTTAADDFINMFSLFFRENKA